MSGSKSKSMIILLAAAGVAALAGSALLGFRFLPGAPADGAAHDTLQAAAPKPKSLGDKEIAATVEHNRAFLRSKCWEPAAAGGRGKGRAQAKVAASLTIDPSGAVQSVTAENAEDFPGLSDCITNAVRHWKFPAAEAPTSIDVPFVFASQ